MTLPRFPDLRRTLGDFTTAFKRLQGRCKLPPLVPVTPAAPQSSESDPEFDDSLPIDAVSNADNMADADGNNEAEEQEGGERDGARQARRCHNEANHDFAESVSSGILLPCDRRINFA